MNILVTGAKGMVGTALVNNLKNIRDGKNRTRPNIHIDNIYCYDLDSTPEQLDAYCTDCDFVFNLAGVNRPQNNEEFMQGNFGFAFTLLDTLKKHGNKSPIMLSSSIQATLIGRYGQSDYGKSKLAGEELFFQYGKENGVKVAVYRFPNLMGHSRPKYNSAVSTFCWAVANDEPFTVNDRATELELLYIDDLIEGMFDLLEGKEKRCEYDGLIVKRGDPRNAEPAGLRTVRSGNGDRRFEGRLASRPRGSQPPCADGVSLSRAQAPERRAGRDSFPGEKRGDAVRRADGGIAAGAGWGP